MGLIGCWVLAGWIGGRFAAVLLSRIPRGVVVCAHRCALAGAVGFGLCAVAADSPGGLVLLTVVCWWALCLSVVDLRVRRLPNALTLSAGLLAMGWAVLCGRAEPAVVGALALTGIYLVVHLLCPRGMGAGDVKLALAVGAATGTVGQPAWLLAAMGAPLLSALGAVLLLIRRELRQTRRGTAGRRNRARHSADPTTVAHGASMCLATLLVLAVSV